MNMRDVNGAANLFMGGVLVFATGIGVGAILQQSWEWWLKGLAICAIAFAWGLLISAIATSTKSFRDSVKN